MSERALGDLISLEGRTAVVTGAAKGIGLASARRLLEAGANVVLIDQDQEALAAAHEGLARRERAMAISLDVTDEIKLGAAAEESIRRFGGIDVWVNNAGISPRVPAIEISRDQWDAVFNLNLRAAFVGSQLAAREMVDTKRPGVLINLLSSCIHHVGGNPAHYRASKAALRALTESLAVELGRHGIRAVGVAPTLTETPAVQRLGESGLQAGFDEFVRRLPLRRIATADEVARVVLFAASDLASFVTGTVLDVDGGESAK